MSTQDSTGHEEYYVPESSGMAISATIGLVLSIFGAANVLNDMTFGEPGAETNSWTIFIVGLFWFAATLFVWFRTTIRENRAGMNSAQLKKSYVLGMFWFIFSEVMFFFCFFGALFYVRVLVGPWLAGEGEGGTMNYLLWEGFDYSWPMMQTPQEAVGGAGAQLIANNGDFVSPHTSMAFGEVEHWWHWLPMWNTLLLLSSSVTVHIAHLGLLANNRSKFNIWLGISVLLALGFLYLQYMEYHEAYVLYGLTLDSGIYGSTFFMLTGFHGFHVAMGMTMLLIQWLRSIRGGHFTADDHFGFEASSWYWHFVDVVWVMLFLLVYIL
ncbi:cytochrome c oxidase subunit 3 [Halieaceae bacterium IMCC14734]|uniref:cytochrome-c oxidase n=1 Tax=Candidatus Litorirhabdus singularis TaxID=2518993 RepID=A0ABT3TET5_9GAMM|nr:cytochrome c oxidase subunit 3 [Candidatus Litorirhabdus singularis]MCX2979937.1 cytochrome c oxidase subunit 3 [Candidatus Litorirhabdus singularis]